jgi:hypothetical protein
MFRKIQKSKTGNLTLRHRDHSPDGHAWRPGPAGSSGSCPWVPAPQSSRKQPSFGITQKLHRNETHIKQSCEPDHRASTQVKSTYGSCQTLREVVFTNVSLTWKYFLTNDFFILNHSGTITYFNK